MEGQGVGLGGMGGAGVAVAPPPPREAYVRALGDGCLFFFKKGSLH